MTDNSEMAHEHREPDHDIHPILLERWSGRAMDGTRIDADEFMPVFEAARWAPSSRNLQPWRFIYVTREDEGWEEYLDLLNEGNRRWAEDGAVLVIVASQTTDDGKHNRTHAFDTGAAWENMALEGTRRGLVVHPMGGIDRQAAHERAGLGDEHAVHCMVVLGNPAPRETLPEDLQERETPSGRDELSGTVFQDRIQER